MEWAQRPGVGPGAELLGDGLTDLRVVELGCGAGHNTAHLAAAGADVTGIDRSPGQLRRATAHYAHTGARFVLAAATAYLAANAEPLDAIISVFGAIGTDEPSTILAACSRRLTRHGILAFSVAHPCRTGTVPATPCPGTTLSLPDGMTATVPHWDITPAAWARAINRAGLRVTGVTGFSAPADAPWPTTLLMTARKP
jgi:SAM-dependent methyltransferase